MRWALALLSALLCGVLPVVRAEAQEAGERPDPRRYAYHLRVVRVVGDSPYRGAGVGCEGEVCSATPVILPSEEVWGSPEQVAALARSLGGERADPVSGFMIQPDRAGQARFEGTVYPGEAALDLSFRGTTPDEPSGPHRLELELLPPGGGAPVAEIGVLASGERTVAIAAPSPVEGEWVVLAVTTLDWDAAEARAAKGAPVELLDGEIAPPRLMEKVSPQYPQRAREERREARVILQAVIDAEGYVRAVQVLRVIPPDSVDFAAAAVEAVQRWRYDPALAAGAPVPVYFTIVVEFEIE